MSAVSRLVFDWRDRLVALQVLDQDALLYMVAAVFALGTLGFAESADYRQWAEMSLGPYLLAAGICWVVARHRARHGGAEPGRRHDRVRKGIVLGLLLTVVLVPLTVEVIFRAESKPGAHVQPEVTTIEACGDSVLRHKNCYLANPKTVGTYKLSQSEDSFFPYLPGMIPFGLINATSGPRELKDARIPLTGFTLIVITGALLIAEIPSRRRWR